MDCGNQCDMSSLNVQPVAQEQGHIDTNALAVLIASGVPLVILDARSAKWDDGKRIATAKTLTADASEEQAMELIPSKESLVVVYCSNVHCSASSHLAKRLSDLGYINILKYEAGIQEWINSGHSVRETL
jgi:rhodanese-related sulfurtransferase